MISLLTQRAPLIGVIHLPPLPGSPRFTGSMIQVLEAARRDAEVLAAAGFDGVLVENFGDAPFVRGRVAAETVAALAVCAEHARRHSGLALGVNVLRNDGLSALAIAAASGACFVRVNVFVGARVTDQGIIETDAAELMRARRAMGLESTVAVVTDVSVKHSSALADIRIDDEAVEAVERGLADGVIVSGGRTGEAASRDAVLAVRAACRAPVWMGSGVTAETLAEWLTVASGVIVGSDLRANGQAGGPIDRERAERFVQAR